MLPNIDLPIILQKPEYLQEFLQMQKTTRFTFQNIFCNEHNFNYFAVHHVKLELTYTRYTGNIK